MEAKDLMIGDLIKTKNNFSVDNELNNKYCKVQFLGNKYIAAVVIDEPEKRPYGNEASFEEIPLTAEILEKNGFTQCEQKGYDLYVKDKDGAGLYDILWQSEPDNYLEIAAYAYPFGEFYKSNIRYVHQLQHALKMCEIKKEIII